MTAEQMQPRQNAHTIPVLWCLTAAALFGASTPASKALLGNIGPLTLAGLLYSGAAAGVFPFALRGGSTAFWRVRRHVTRLAGAVVFGGVIGPVLLLLGLSIAPAASVSLWLNLETVATALLAWVFFGELMDRRTLEGMALVVAAGVILASPSGFGHAGAALLVLLACVCWGLDNNLTAVIDGFTPQQTTFVKGLIAGAVNIALGLALEQNDGLTLPVVLGALVLGSLSYGLSIVLYILGAQNLGATKSQMLFSTAPFLGVFFSWTLLGEPVTLAQVFATLLIVGGLVTLLSGRHGHEHTHEAMTHTHSHRHDDGHHTHVHPGLPAWIRHTHPHDHEPITHAHPHMHDLHHRHFHRVTHPESSEVS